MGAESGVRRRVKGLSEGEFRQRFGTEAQCRAALFSLRWGKGWACPGCGHAGYAELKGRAVYQCNRCKRQVGLTAGTVFHWTKLPLTGPVPGDLPPHAKQGRDELGRAGAAARHTAADRLADQAQADGGDGGARGGEAQARRAGGDGRRLSRWAARWRQARPRCGRQDAPFVAAVETSGPSASRAGCG